VSQASPSSAQDPKYLESIRAVEKTLSELRGCPDAELEQLQHDISQLNEMYEKVTTGRVEIVIFEKSAPANPLS
jgi:hypothetical protein